VLRIHSPTRLHGVHTHITLDAKFDKYATGTHTFGYKYVEALPDKRLRTVRSLHSRTSELSIQSAAGERRG